MRSETSFDRVGDLIFVDAVIVGPSGRAEVQLLLDTGAVLTTLVPRIAESIGYTPATRVARSVIRSAVAKEHGYIVRLTPRYRRSDSRCLTCTQTSWTSAMTSTASSV